MRGGGGISNVVGGLIWFSKENGEKKQQGPCHQHSAISVNMNQSTSLSRGKSVCMCVCVCVWVGGGGTLKGMELRWCNGYVGVGISRKDTV